MKAPKETRPQRIEFIFTSKLLKAMEERVNNHDVGIQAIYSRGDDKIEVKPTDPAIPHAPDGIQQKPGEKLQEMRTGEGGDFVPDDGAGAELVCNAQVSKGQAFDPLGIQMNLTVFFVRKALQQFSKGALGAVPAVNKR